MRTIAELLEAIKQLQEREQKGENVSDELAQVRAELEQRKAAESAAGNGNGEGGEGGGEGEGAQRGAEGRRSLTETEVQELARLRSAEQERIERGVAERAVSQVLDGIKSEETRRQERIQQYATEAVKAALGGESLGDAVHSVLANTRGGSRFAGPGSSDDVLDTLAAGGSVENGRLTPPPGSVEGRGVAAGEHKGVKAIEESKNFAHLLSMLKRAKDGWFMLSEAEQLFLQKSYRQDLASHWDVKAMAQSTDTAGGFLVPEQWMPDILTPLRAQAVVRRATPRIVGFDKQMNQTSLSSGAVAYYFAENARITPSEAVAAETPILTPKWLGALVPVGNTLLNNWNNSDTMIRDDMVEAIAVREDLAFLQGSVAGEPTGLRNIAGQITNPLAPGTDGFVPTLPQLRQLKGRTRMVSAPNPRWTWFFNPSILTYLETLTDTTGRFLVDAGILRINDDGVSGTFDGFPFYASYQIPVNLTMGTSTNVTYILLVDMKDAIIGEEEQLALAVSTEATYSPDGGTTHISAFQQNQTVFRAITAHDITHRRPATGIIVQEGVRTS